MIEISAGPVTLSDRRTERSWTVEVGRYALGAVPVTQDLYERVTGERPGTARGDRLPVEGVSWGEAVRFCNALSAREGLRPAYRVPADESDGPAWDRTAGRVVVR